MNSQLSEIEERMLATGCEGWTDLALARDILQGWFARPVPTDILIGALSRLSGNGWTEKRLSAVPSARSLPAAHANRIEFRTTMHGSRLLAPSANDATI